LRPRQRKPFDAVARNRHRDRPHQHQRLVADVDRRVSTLIDHHGPAQPSAVAAAEYDRRLSEFTQQLYKGPHRRSFAGTADMIVADTKHGNAGSYSFTLQSMAGDRTVDGSKRHQ
jgi:hypothetical protein